MNNLYNTIELLCSRRAINITTMCKEAGISRAPLSDLKMGRSKSLSADTLSKLSDYFGVTIDYLLTGEETEKSPSEDGEGITDDDIKVALFGGAGEVTDEMWEEAKFAIELIKNRRRKKLEKDEGTVSDRTEEEH